MDLGHPLAIVTPTLDGDVLAVLAHADHAFTTGQLHRMLGAFSEDGIRKVLMRLAGQGIVRAERIGNAYSYRLNRDHLGAQPIIELANLRQTLLDRVEQEITIWLEPALYGAMFGSAARGDMHQESDVDLLLVRRDDADEDTWDSQVLALSARVTAWTGNDTRVLVLTESHVHEADGSEPVLESVRREGLTVAGSRAWLQKALSRRARR